MALEDCCSIRGASAGGGAGASGSANGAYHIIYTLQLHQRQLYSVPITNNNYHEQNA